MKHLLIILLMLSILLGCTTTSEKWYDSDTELYVKFANYMNTIIFKEVVEEDMTILGVNAYSSQTLFVHYFMASVGYAQTIKNCPQYTHKYIKGLEKALDLMSSEKAMQFDTDAWEANALTDFRSGSKNTHGAFMFYYNFAIGLHVLLVPDSKYKGLHDSISNFLLDRLYDTKFRIIETYPGEYWTADMSVAYGSLGIYQRNIDKKLPKLYGLSSYFIKEFCDKSTGLVYQNVELDNQGDLYKMDVRGSSSAYSAFFLAYLSEKTSSNILYAINNKLYESNIVYAGVRENLRSVTARDDIGYGPVISGLGVVASGFTIGAAKIIGWKDMFQELYGTASKVGMASESAAEIRFRIGTHVGNSIMFALLTSGPFTKESRDWVEGYNDIHKNEMKSLRRNIFGQWF